MTLYRRCAHHGDLRMQAIHDCDGYMPVEPDHMLEVRLERSEPTTWGRYRITLTSDQPANSLTMHGKLFLIRDDEDEEPRGDDG